MKNMPKIFDGISEDTVNSIMVRLMGMRVKHPGLRDDQLLLYMLCKAEELHPDATPENVPYAGD